MQYENQQEERKKGKEYSPLLILLADRQQS